MQTVDSDIGLRNAIIQMEMKLANEEQVLQEQAHLVLESINPINLINSVLNHVTESPIISDKLISSSVGLSAGYISKLLFQATTKGRFNKQIGTAIMFSVAKAVSRNPEAIKSAGNFLLKILLRKTREK